MFALATLSMEFFTTKLNYISNKCFKIEAKKRTNSITTKEYQKTKHVDELGSNVMGVIYKNEFTPLKIRNMTNIPQLIK